MLALAIGGAAGSLACAGTQAEPRDRDGDGGAAGAAAGARASASSGASAAGGADAAGGEAESGGAGAGGARAVLVLVDCQIPDAQLLPTVHGGALLSFLAAPTARLDVGSAVDRAASAPDGWQRQSTLLLPPADDAQQLTVFARLADPRCAAASCFQHTYEIREAYPGPAGQPGSTAIAFDDEAFVGWATGWVEPVAYGTDLDEKWRLPEQALGPATGDGTDVVSLGNGGSITLTFETPIADGPGPDLVVFENGYNDTFLELGHVEVSSDAEHFVRFDSAYLGEEPVSQYGAHETTLLEGLAGKYRQGFGGPFDLSLLRYRPRVQAGQVDLSRITHVRIVDIVGDGTDRDSFGHPIYDPYPSVGSGGFDLEAIGVLHAAD
jgi:hypothetical protein